MNYRMMPYYLTRFVLSAAMSVLVFGVHWAAAFSAVVLFAGFVLYLKSGWFVVDEAHPIFPLRRDDHGVRVQHSALTWAIPAAFAIYALVALGLAPWVPTGLALNYAVAAGAVVYLGLQWFLFARA